MDLMMRRNALLACGKRNRLPSEYQEVEWIERDVEGAIITIESDDLNMIGCDIYITVAVLSTSGERAYAGYSGSDAWELYFRSSLWGNRGVANKLSVIESTVYDVGKKGTTHLKILDVYANFTLGHYRYGGYQSKNRYYQLCIEKDEVLMRNMIPCYRKSDGEVGMYDIVTGKFYTNTGNGTFTKGADV